MPTSYIWGRHDVALSRRVVELTADYVVGPYEVVELEAGHWLPETKPDAVADAILARVGLNQPCSISPHGHERSNRAS